MAFKPSDKFTPEPMPKKHAKKKKAMPFGKMKGKGRM